MPGHAPGQRREPPDHGPGCGVAGDDALREAIDELYSADPDEFMQRRGELAAAAKKSGGTAAGKQITALRKPTRSAYAVNMLARADPDKIDDLLDLGSQLREAERSVDAKLIRELTTRRRRLVDELTRRAFEVIADAAPSSAVRDEVVSTLTAALADQAVAEQIADGTLVKPARWEGFGFGGAPDLSVVPGPAADSSPARPSRPSPRSDEAGRTSRPGERSQEPKPLPANASRPTNARSNDSGPLRRRRSERSRRRQRPTRPSARPWRTPGRRRTTPRRPSSWPPTRSRPGWNGSACWRSRSPTPGARSTRHASNFAAPRSGSAERRTRCGGWNVSVSRPCTPPPARPRFRRR